MIQHIENGISVNRPVFYPLLSTATRGPMREEMLSMLREDIVSRDVVLGAIMSDIHILPQVPYTEYTFQPLWDKGSPEQSLMLIRDDEALIAAHDTSIEFDGKPLSFIGFGRRHKIRVEILSQMEDERK